MKKSKPETTDNPVAHFETSLKELEQLVAALEQGDQSLETSLAQFERGIALFRQCQHALETAELRVNQLLDPNDPGSAKAFEFNKTEIP